MSKGYEESILSNLENVNTGMVLKNYKELCKLFGLDVKTSNAKKAQLKEIERFVKLDKNCTKYIISEKYEEPLCKIYRNTNTTRLVDTHPEYIKYIVDSYGEDKINSKSKKIIKWKCSLCYINFERRIDRVCNSSVVRCVDCSSSSGEKIVSGIIRELNLEYKKEITFNELVSFKGNPLRFDFGIYISGNLLCIIEYDGQYHDISEKIILHDKIKNNYCKVNNIPLLRIHHTINKNDIKMIIVKFIYNLYKLDTLKEYLIDEIKLYKTNISSLMLKVDKLNKEIMELESIINK